MQVVESRKSLLLHLRVPEQVKAVVPKSKEIKYKGKNLLEVPHTLDVVRVLNNLGIKAPSPIKHYYNWSGQYTPFDAQRDTAAFLTVNNRAFVLNDLGCVDADTEYLTPTGWRRIADYDGGFVGQYHPDSGSVSFVDSPEYVKKPCHQMLRVKTKYGVDQLLSPEHRVLIADRAGTKQETLQAHELKARHDLWVETGRNPKSLSTIGYGKASIPCTYFVEGGCGIDLSDAELRVQVAVMADGHFPPNNTDRCIVRLKKPRKIERLRQLLEDAGIESYERAQPSTGFTIFSFSAPWKVKEYDSRFWEATAAQLAIVRDEVVHWDGCDRVGKPTVEFISNSKASADFVQYAFNTGGRTARIVVDKRGPTYSVLIRNHGAPLQLAGSGSNGRRTSMEWVESPDGYKYCFMVPSTYLILRRNGCVFASGNTGKSLSALWAYDYLRIIGQVRKALIISPLSTLERVWDDEIFRHFPHLSSAVLYGTRAKRKKLLEQDVDVYIINHDGVKVLKDDLAKREDIDLVVVDEIAQCARNAGTNRWKALKAVTKDRKRLWGLTGTPIPNAPTDAWAQCRLVVPENVPPYFTRFRDQVMRQCGPYKWIARHGALDIVYDCMKPSIRYSRDDCIDLPDVMYETREVPLSKEQMRMYKDMLEKLSAELEGEQIQAVNEGVKLQKLIQIACGTAYSLDGGVIHVEPTDRLKELRDLIESSNSKTIVFVPFTATAEMVAEHLEKNGYSTGLVYGDVSKAKRDQIFLNFQKADNPRVLVAQPAAMSHGLTLTAASTIVWFAPVTSGETYEQANARITRPGQKYSQLIVNIQGTPAEARIYERLKEKATVQGVLLDLVRQK